MKNPVVAYGPLEVANISLLINTDTNLDHYAQQVRIYSAARKIQIAAWNISQSLGSPQTGSSIREQIDQFASLVLQHTDCSSGSLSECTIRDGMKWFIGDLDERMNRDSAIVGLPYGIMELDQKTCGLEPQEYVVLAARPSMGKTALALQVTRTIAGMGKKVLWFSLDMSKEGLWQRLVAHESSVNLQDLRTGSVERNKDYPRAASSAHRLGGLPITVIDSPCTELDIMRVVRRSKPDLIIVDFLTKVMPTTESKNTVADYTHISQSIKNILKEYNVPGLILCQLSRSNEKEHRRPRLSDLRETGAIEQDADTVIFLHSKDKIEPTRELIIDKQRQGECGIFTLNFDGRHQRFYSQY